MRLREINYNQETWWSGSTDFSCPINLLIIHKHGKTHAPQLARHGHQ